MMITLFRCLVFLICFQGLMAQTKIIGKVTDKNGDPIPGAGVLEKGTGNEVATDLDGNYAILVKEGAVLEFYMLGFESQDISTDEKTTINVVLQEKIIQIDKVVVTALGIKRKEKALSYSLQQVNQEEFTRVKDANFVNSLNGKVAGVNIKKSSSGIGGATRVVLRGLTSIQGNNNVLYVVDGVPFYNISNGSASDNGAAFQDPAGTEGIADLNPEDIESVSVLTGPSAAALYGYQGANGVILVNTKKGKEGVAVTLSSNTEFLRPFITPDFQNTYGNRPGEYASWGKKLSTPSSYDPLDFFKTGVNQINSAAISIGNKKNQTFLSLSSTNSKGIIPNNEYNRYNFTLRNTSSFLNDKMHLDLSASYIKQDEKNMIAQGLYFNPLVSLYLFPPAENFDLVKFYERYDPSRNISTQYWPYGDDRANQNPYWIAYRMLFPRKRNRYMFSARLDYDIFSWLNVATRVRIDNTYESREKKYYASTIETHARKKGYYGFEQNEQKQTYADLIFNLKKRFGAFNLNANIGGSFSDFNPSLSRGVQGHLLTVPNFFDYSNIDPKDDELINAPSVGEPYRNNSLFGLAEVSYKDLLYLTLTGRNDWDSHLVNSKEPSFFYPSVGLSGIISKMVKLPDFISFLKVRSSYTEVGSPISITSATPRTRTRPIRGGTLSERSDYAFPPFKAERTRSWEAGLNMRLLHNHIDLDATFYESNTYNQTLYADAPSSSAYNRIPLQAGRIRNRGIELTFGYDTRPKKGKFGYNTHVAYTLNENKIMELVHDYPNPLAPGEKITITEILKSGGASNNRYNLLREGGRIDDVYVNRFLKTDSQGNIYVSPSGDLLPDDTNQVVKIGHTAPNFTIGWRHHFSYKGLNLNLLFNGRFGGIVNSTTQANLDAYGVSKKSEEARDRGGVDINGGKYDAEKYYKMIGTGDGMQAYYTYDATNIRLQEISLSYTLYPTFLKKKGFKSLTVSLTGNNLWMIYNKAPFDPELTASTGTYAQGYDYFMSPSMQSFGMGIKLKF